LPSSLPELTFGGWFDQQLLEVVADAADFA
jgi:hypothetical protein